MPILSGLRSKPKKLNFSKTMEEIKDTTLKSLYNDLQEKISPKSSATTLIATLEKLYKTFMGVQKTKVGAAIDLPDAVVFVQLFPSLFQTIIDKQEASQFHDKVMGLAVNVQEIVWKQYEYEKLKRASLDHLFLPARYVWIALEKFAETSKVVRAIIFTMQYIEPNSCHSLLTAFSSFVENDSSSPGFGNILTNDIILLVCPKFTKGKSEIKKENMWTGSVNRESFKELKAMISCLKHHMQFTTTISMSTKITRSGCLIKLIQKILKKPGNVEKWYLSGELENCISALGQIYQRIHSDMIREKTDDSWNDYFFYEVGLEFVVRCSQLCEHLTPTAIGLTQNVPYATTLFVGHRFVELLTHRHAQKIPLEKRQELANRVLKHLAPIFRAAYEYHKFMERTMGNQLTLIDSKGNRSHWGLFLDAIDAMFKSAKNLSISVIPLVKCFKINLDDMETFSDEINDTILTHMMDQIVKWVAPDVSGLNLFDIFDVHTDAHRSHLWLVFVSALMHIGIAKDINTLKFIVETIVSSHEILLNSDEAEDMDMDFLSLLMLQVESIDKNIAIPIKNIIKNRQSKSVIVTIWKNLIPWHQQVSAAWQNGIDLAAAPALDVRLISGISVKQEYKNRNPSELSTTHRTLLIQTIAIAGELLLIIGKRADGRRLLMELLELTFEWEQELREMDDSLAELIVEIMMEVAQSAWLDYDTTHSNSLLEYVDLLEDFSDEIASPDRLIENIRLVAVFANWKNKNELNIAYSKLPKTLFSRMQGDSNDFYRHSMGQAATACHSKRQTAPNLRYCVQIHSSLVSTITDRSFFQTLFMTNQSKSGSITMPNFGHDTLMAFRNIEKIIWYTRTITEEFLARGFTTEVRQFSNELVVTSEIWGLQIPYLIGKSNQVRALHFEGQRNKWQEEISKLAKSLKEDCRFIRQLEPSAVAEAISLEPVRRNSSTVSQQEEAMENELNLKPIPSVTVTSSGDGNLSPSSFEPRKRKPLFSVDIPPLPNLSKVDVDSATAIIYAFNTIFLVMPDADKAVQSGLKMLQEIHKVESNLTPSAVYETISTVLTRSVQLEMLDYHLEIEQALRVIAKRSDGFKGREFGRFCLTRVMYMKHCTAINGNAIAKEIIPTLSKLQVDDGHHFKTPQRPRKKSPSLFSAKSTTKAAKNAKTPIVKSTRRLVVPKTNRLPSTPKFEIYKDVPGHLPMPNLATSSNGSTSVTPSIKSKTKSSISISGTPSIRTRTKSKIKGKYDSDDEWKEPKTLERPEDLNIKGVRRSARNTKNKVLNAAGNDEVPEGDRGLLTDDVFTPGKNIESTGMEVDEAPRKTVVTSSRPTSPLENAHENGFPDHVRPNFTVPDENDMLNTALKVARENGDLETARATMYVRINNAIEAHFQKHRTDQMISSSKEFAQLHIDSAGIGAIFDTEFSCQSRLSNTISPSEFPEKSKNSAKDMLRYIDGNQDAKLTEPVVLLTLVPSVSESLRCRYTNCHFVVTRLEPSGSCLSVAFDGKFVWKRCDEMLRIVEKVAAQLGDGGAGDARVWWAHRRQHNDEIVQLVSKTLPDAMDIALPLLSLPATPNLSQFKDTAGIVLPRDAALRAYLGYVVTSWHDLPLRTKQHITAFYTDRTSARLTFQNIIKSVSTEPNSFQRETTTYLICARLIQQCPIERLKVMEGIRVSRFPSLKHVKYLTTRSMTSKSITSVDVSKLFYLIDNQGNLDVTNQTLYPFFSAPKSWKGFAKTNPKSNDMLNGLNMKSLYVFCGHGSGSDAVGGWGRVQRKGISSHCHLIGCSSGRLRDTGRTEPRGTPLKILDAGAPSVMALLWSVTDRDIDRYTLRLYADWFSAKSTAKNEPGPNLAAFISSSEIACKLGPLNGGAAVNYGILPCCYNVPENWDKGLPKKINYKDTKDPEVPASINQQVITLG